MSKSSDELLRKVGEPNQVIKERGYTYYLYFVQPASGGWTTKHLDVCHGQFNEASSVYYVIFDADMKAQSVVYYMFAGADAQRVRVPGADGLMLPATLYRPRGCGTSREPAIVLLHGWNPTWREALGDPLLDVGFFLHYPLLTVSFLLHSLNPAAWRDKGDTETGLEFEAELLAEHGYAVLLPLMRGWGGGQLDCGLSQSADTAGMIEWLASQPGVDPDRIGVIGGSFGGQVALLTGALSHRVRAIVSYDAPTDLVSASAQSPWYDWPPKECRSDLKSPSPVNVASRIKAPVLLIQGDADRNVLPEQAEEMEQALRESGGSVQLYLVSGARHRDGNELLLSSWSVTQQFLEANLGKPSCVQGRHAADASAQRSPPASQALKKAQRLI